MRKIYHYPCVIDYMYRWLTRGLLNNKNGWEDINFNKVNSLTIESKKIIY